MLAIQKCIFFGILITTLCLYVGMDTPAFAHDCVGRMTNAKSLGDLLAQTTIEDCMRTGYIQALLTAITAAMAGGAISIAVARALRAGQSTEPPPGGWLDGWNLTDPDAFCKLGKRMANLPQFQKADTPEKKAQFALDCMRDVADRYKLRAATGSDDDEKLIGYYRQAAKPVVRRTIFSGLVGAVAFGAGYAFKYGAATLNPYVVAGGFLVGAIAGYFSTLPRPPGDAEDLAPLKYGRLGNCGEWAIALQTSLQCAGVPSSQRVAADDSPGKNFSEGHAGTYTTIMHPRSSDPNLEHPESWTFYDVFMSLSDKNKTWSGLTAEQWMNNFRKKKAFIKDANGTVKAWRCVCGTINAWNVGNCIKCKAASSLPNAR